MHSHSAYVPSSSFFRPQTCIFFLGNKGHRLHYFCKLIKHKCYIEQVSKVIKQHSTVDHFKSIKKFFVNPLTPVPPVTKLGLSSTSDIITLDQNWHHLYSNSAAGKDLSNDAQIRVIGQMEPWICTKMLEKLSEKLRAKFPATTPGCSMLKIARLNDAFSEVF